MYLLWRTEPKDREEDCTAHKADAQEDPGQLHMDILFFMDVKSENHVGLLSQNPDLQVIRRGWPVCEPDMQLLIVLSLVIRGTNMLVTPSFK